MYDTITKITTQILNDEKELIGAGFLVNESMVLTCAHIVEGITTPEQPTKAISVYIPSIEHMCDAVVVIVDKEHDLAELELLEPILEEKRNELFTGLILAKLSAWNERKVVAFGFPESAENGATGIFSPGIVRGPDLRNLMQMDPSGDAANLVERGFSGGPVIDVALNQIVGMLIEYINDNRTAYFVPLDVIVTICPDLIGLVDEPENNLIPFAAKLDDVKKVDAIFVAPRSFSKAKSILQKEGLLWIKGSIGIGKRTCAIKLAKDSGKNVYIIDAGQSWTVLEDLNVQQSAIVFIDYLGKKRFERENLDLERDRFESFMRPERQNFLIFTANNEVFDEAIHQTDLYEWSKNCLFELTERLYEPSGKLKTKKPLYEIYRNLLKYAEDKKQLTSNQLEWAVLLIEQKDSSGVDIKSANELRQLFQRQMDNAWRPADIERFVNYLAGINKWPELTTLLRQEAELEAQVHSWFITLDHSSQVFLLVLSMLAGISLDGFWSHYREVATKFRELDSSLAILPLGLLRQRTVPYVTTKGTLDFVSPRAALAVTREVIRMYREYLLILVDPILIHWSQANINEKSQITRDQILAQEEIRRSVAETVGEALKYCEESSLIKLIEIWAQNYWQEISSAAAISLRKAQEEPERNALIFSLLDKWLSELGGAEDAYRRRWTTANTLWRIGLDFPDYRDMVLKRLQRLAGDKVDYVLDGTAQAVRNLVGTIPFDQLEPIYSRLAHCRVDEIMIKVRRQIVFGLVKQTTSDTGSDEVFDVIDNWAHSNSTNIRWTAMYVLIFARQLSQKQRMILFDEMHQENPNLTVDVFCTTLSSQNQKIRSSAILALKAFWKPTRPNSTFRENLAYISVDKFNSLVKAIQNIRQSETDEINMDKDADATLRDILVYVAGEILDQALAVFPIKVTILRKYFGTAINYPIIQEAISIRASNDFHKFTNQLFLATADDDELRIQLETCCGQASDEVVQMIPVFIMRKMLEESLIPDSINVSRLLAYLSMPQSHSVINSAFEMMANQNYGQLINTLAEALSVNQQVNTALNHCCASSNNQLIVELPRTIDVYNKQKELSRILFGGAIDAIPLQDILGDMSTGQITISALDRLMTESYDPILNSLGEAVQLKPEILTQLRLLCEESQIEQVNQLPALVTAFNTRASQNLATQWSELIYRDFPSFVQIVISYRQLGKSEFVEQTLIKLPKSAEEFVSAKVAQLMKSNSAEKILVDCINLTHDMEQNKKPKSVWFSGVLNTACIAVFDTLGKIPLTEVRFGLLGLDPVIFLYILKNTHETSPARLSKFFEGIKEGALLAPFRYLLVRHIVQGSQRYPIDLDFLPYELRKDVSKAT